MLPSYLAQIHCNIITPPILPIPVEFSRQNQVCASPLSYMCHITCPFRTSVQFSTTGKKKNYFNLNCNFNVVSYIPTDSPSVKPVTFILHSPVYRPCTITFSWKDIVSQILTHRSYLEMPNFSNCNAILVSLGRRTDSIY